ncbi:MAG: hypothetical protein OXF79_07065 [Chloroflexi bacterium]|nr:hypothetical protein [Chloroflexota bacterium]
MGSCKHCGEKAGFLRRSHKECDNAHRAGRQRMVALVADAAGQPHFSEAALVGDLEAIAAGAYINEDGIRAAIAEGWHQAVREGLADGILTQAEEARLRDFRDQFAIEEEHKAGREATADLDRAARDRLMLDARLAALATNTGDDHLDDLAHTMEESGFARAERRSLLIQAWEAAVEGSLEDGVLSLDEENALIRYLQRFGLEQSDVDANGAYHNMIKSAVIREAAEGLIPERLGELPQIPFNLMKSEQLVWVIDGVDYYEVKTRRERRGTSHGVSIRVAKGLYYRPSTFSSRAVEWEETVHEDTGLLGVTSKHIYFHGPRKRFRIRYDRIVSFDPYADGIGVMRDAQTAKPQEFRTGDGWFIYNLVTNLAQRW